MKKNAIESVHGQEVTKKKQFTDSLIYPTSQQINYYQNLSYELRSKALASITLAVSRYFASKWSKLNSYWLQRKTVARLDQLTPAMLKDIGLTSADVEQLRYRVTTVEAINERRLKLNDDRFSINKRVNLQLCECNQKIEKPSPAKNSMLANCG